MPKGNVFFTAWVATFGSSLMRFRIFADGEELTHRLPSSHHKKGGNELSRPLLRAFERWLLARS